MLKKFSFLALSTVLLAACKMGGTVVEEGADSSAAASTEASAAASVSSVGDEATGVWGTVQKWAPTLVWSNTVRGTSDVAINVDAEHMIPAGAIQTTAVMTPITAEQYLMIFQDGPSHAALDAALAADGWTTLATLDADGATGTQWGYTKTDASGIQFLVVSANGTDCVGSPAICTTYMAKISATDALSEGDDL